MELLTTVLAFLHIFCAMGWIGGGFLFGFVIAPKLSKMSLAGSRDFVLTIVPGVLRFFQVIAGLTILFGVLLLYVMTQVDHSQTLSTSNTWGWAIYAGVGVAVVAFLFSEFVAVPVFKTLVELNRRMNPDGTNVPAELPRGARRAAMVSLTALVLLLVAMSFMVAAGFY